MIPSVHYFYVKAEVLANLRIYISEPLRVKNRSSHRRCFVRKGVLRNFVKFAGKHLYLRVSDVSRVSRKDVLGKNGLSGLKLNLLSSPLK